MKTVKTIILLISLILISSIAIKAQAPLPPADPTAGGNQAPYNPTGAPIDGGLSIFLVLAAAYAGRKVRIENRK
ncbi:MAG: hypothetical protein WCL00_01345 [Bacteroidota bacterium]